MARAGCERGGRGPGPGPGPRCERECQWRPQRASRAAGPSAVAAAAATRGAHTRVSIAPHTDSETA
eukprot:3762931-Rhodomonas_salina.2